MIWPFDAMNDDDSDDEDADPFWIGPPEEWT